MTEHMTGDSTSIFDPNSMDPTFEEQRAEHVAATTKSMEAAGVTVEEKVEPVEDYYGFAMPQRWYFPSGREWIEFSPMDEGRRRRYQTKTATVLTMNKASGDSRIGLNVARDREALLSTSVTDWNMVRRDPQTGAMVPVPFKDPNYGFMAWANGPANPLHIDGLERVIRKANPWLQQETSPEELDRQIAELEELRDEIRAAEAGKNDF